MKSTFLLCAIVGLLLVLGCETKRKGPLEKAGERTDEIIDNIQDGENPLHRKGTMEKAGEAIDDAVDPDKRRRE